METTPSEVQQEVGVKSSPKTQGVCLWQGVRKESKSSQGLQLLKNPRPHAFGGGGAKHLTLFIYFYSLTCVLAGGLQSSRAVAFSSYRTPQHPCLVSRTERPSSFICGRGGRRGEQAS